jgi:hypothetical protein
METGHCYCGAVQYELDGPIGPLVNCHCRSCRRAHGAAFATVAMLASAAFRIRSGSDDLAEIASGEGFRSFCRRCGGRLFNRPAGNPGITMLAVSTLDAEPATAAIMHVNVESKAPWYEIRDDLPQYPGLPPLPGGPGNGEPD